MIIYPPIIGNTIPAFTSIIEVPFTHNPAVGINEVKTMRLVIRTISNNEVIVKDINAKDFNLETGIAYFNVNELTLIPTQWYKFQIAYDDGNQNNVFYYSSVATGRYLGEEPGEIKIINLDSGVINSNLVEYIGCYTSSIYSEQVYQYNFSVQEKGREDYIQETGWIITNKENKSINEEDRKVFKHNFYLKDELELGKQYTITYTIQTVNGWKNSVSYTIQKAMRVPSVFAGSVIVDQASSESREYGYVNIKLSGEESTNGNFYLYRSQDKRIWNQLGSFTLTANSNLSNFSWKDFTVEQGVTYTYAIAQYAESNGTSYISKRILSNPITVDFEHTYLGDGERQLIVKFNPQVSSFKDTILEQKTDTIGGKYPFFFRNEQVRYKEIPISGLLSYQLDDNHFFMSDEELGLEKNLDSRESTGSKNNVEYKNRTTQLVGYNISAERRFKLAVNDWLTNGKPKLFRSPTEGNYIIRLMNVSLSPNATVARMLHTFSATGYQIADAGYEACKANGLDTITPDLKDPEPARHFATIVVNGGQSNQSFDYEYITNLTYIANSNLLDSKFTITQNEEVLELYPTQGTITLPAGQYTNLNYSDTNLNGTFIIEYVAKGISNDLEDSFENLINDTIDSFVTLTEATNYNIPMGYYLTAYRNNDEESYIVINNQKIILLAGAYCYEDLQYNSVLNEIHNAIVVIYGRFKEE